MPGARLVWERLRYCTIPTPRRNHCCFSVSTGPTEYINEISGRQLFIQLADKFGYSFRADIWVFGPRPRER